MRVWIVVRYHDGQPGHVACVFADEEHADDYVRRTVADDGWVSEIISMSVR